MKKKYGKRVTKEEITNHAEAANRLLELRRTRFDRDHRMYRSDLSNTWVIASYELLPRVMDRE